MTQAISKPLTASDDIASLFSHYGMFSGIGRYHELVTEENALDAALRWPLLAEFERVEGVHSDAVE